MEAYLSANYATVPGPEIARALGLTLRQVQCKAHAKGLKKAARRPWNAGMAGQMPEGWGDWGRTAKFKPGHTPHNVQPVGSEAIRYGRPYMKVRMSGTQNECWRPKQEVIWERHHGRPVPPRHVVVFRDGDRNNYAPENLELLSPQERMARNSIHNLPKQVAQLLHLRGVLNRQIKRIENGK